MSRGNLARTPGLAERLAQAEATILALLSGQIDAVVDPRSQTPLLLSNAQEALRASEERYRRIVMTANEGICTLDTRSNITFVNERLAELLGYRVDELLGKSIISVLAEPARSRITQRIERARTGASEENDVLVERKDGKELWALIKSSPILDSDGSFIGVLAMVTDKTRSRMAEEALRKSEQRYRQIVESTSDGIVMSDGAGVVFFVNQRFTELLGYQAAEIVGTSFFAFLNDAAKLALSSVIDRRRQGVKEVIDTTCRHKDGTDIAVNVAASPLVDGDGRYVGNLGVIRDMTERNKLQAQLMVSDRMASVGTLAAGVAHEINNPLAAVIANLDYVDESLRRMAGEAETGSSGPTRSGSRTLDEVRSALDDAREAAQRVRFIVRDLKIFSRSPADEPLGTVDVKPIMESTLRMAWNEIRHRARLVKSYGPVPSVKANEARLGQVFLNLVVNAAQAMQEGGAEDNEIRVSTRLDGGRVIVEVSDNGPGIAPEIIGRIFDAFFTTKAVGVGTGLGLAICQRIVADMRGELTVESEVGKGTTFRVSLPAASAEDIECARPVDALPAPGRRGKILVVDDEELVLRVVKRMLGTEHDVVTALSAKDALALCEAGSVFDLILCDLMMPDMTGMDLHRELLRVAPAQADQMIFLTGGAFTAQARAFLSEIPKEHLEKPFDPGNLRAIVRRHLR